MSVKGTGTQNQAGALYKVIEGVVQKALKANVDRKAFVKSVDVQGGVCKILMQGDPDQRDCWVTANFSPQLIPLVGDVVHVTNTGGKFRVVRVGSSAGLRIVSDAAWPLQLGGASDLVWRPIDPVSLGQGNLYWSDPFTFYDVSDYFSLPYRNYVKIMMPVPGKTYTYLDSTGGQQVTFDYTNFNGFPMPCYSRLYVAIDFDDIKSQYTVSQPLVVSDNYVIISDSYTGKIPENYFLLAWFENEVLARDSVTNLPTMGNTRVLRSGTGLRVDYTAPASLYTLTNGVSPSNIGLQNFSYTKANGMRYIVGALRNLTGAQIPAGNAFATLLEPGNNRSPAYGSAVLTNGTGVFNSVAACQLNGNVLSCTSAVGNGVHVFFQLIWKHE